jgi:hypothetical protein
MISYRSICILVAHRPKYRHLTMTDSITGVGVLYVRSRIARSAQDILDEQTFLRWYDEDHIAEVVSTSGIHSGFRCIDVTKTSALGDTSNPTPFLAFYPMDDMSFTLGEEFRKIKVKSDMLPGSGVVYDMADFDVSYLGLKEKTERKKDVTGAAKFVLSCGIRPHTSQAVGDFFKKQQEHVCSEKGYVRTLSFELQYARTNAQSRKLKGLPTTDEPSLDPSTHLMMHEFDEEPGSEIVDSARERVGEMGNVQGEVCVWELQRSHGNGKFFD